MRVTNRPRAPLFLALASLVALPACEAPTEPVSPPVAAPSEQAHHQVRPRGVQGNGEFVVGEGLLREFSFAAQSTPRGVSRGHFKGYNPASGGRISGRVTCLAIAGDRVWVAGTIEKANFDVVGVETGWIARDGDVPGASGPDQLSFAVLVESAEGFCAERPGPPPGGLVLQDLVSGDINIR